MVTLEPKGIDSLQGPQTVVQAPEGALMEKIKLYILYVSTHFDYSLGKEHRYRAKKLGITRPIMQR